MTRGGDIADAARDARFAAPQPASGLALRSAVLERLAAPGVRLGVITAPAGYGKTSHAAVFVSHDERVSAWLDIEDWHNDALVLLADLTAALRAVTDFHGPGLPTGGATPDQLATIVARDFGRATRPCTVPFVLVLDDVHRLHDQSALDVVGALASNVPPGAIVVLVGRACQLADLARLRIDTSVVELGVEDLALETPDVATALSNMGVTADAEHVERVVADTEGWPVGVRLAGLASLADVRHQTAGSSHLSGRDTTVLDYLRSEWLWNLRDDDREFLRRVSVLDWLSGDLCNAVLDRHDCGEVLHRIYSDRLLVIPLDRREGAYRMHGLLRDALAAELERGDAAAAQQVHARASTWFEAEGDVDRAVRHAVEAADLGRAEHLVVAHTPAFYANGHYTTIRTWVELIPRDRVRQSPELCLCAAVATIGLGDMRGCSVWLRLGEHATTPETRPETRLCLLDLRSTTNTGLARPALDDAAAAYRGLPPGIWHTGACLAYGVWSWTVGDDDAVEVLAEGAAEAAVLGAPAMEANCTAVLALIAHDEGDRARARSLAVRARQLLVDHGLERVPSMAVVTAAHALAASSAGDAAIAQADWHLARAQLAYFRDVSGWANVQVRIALARTSLLLGDRMGAETMLSELHEYLLRQPDAVRAQRQVAEIQELVRQVHRNSAFGSSSLTTAELRVLHYLPTNLSLAEIGTRLYVSRYTVKTHCASIYRKLNVTSRSEAVESARRIGLLDGSRPDEAL
jgi:LuxR family transcriptional regulator, maltose regulon positive regulatory protein